MTYQHISDRFSEPTNITELRELFTETRAKTSAHNWPEQFALFVGNLPLKNENISSYHTRLVRGWSARILETAHSQVKSIGGNTSTFEAQFAKTIDLDKLPPILKAGVAEPISGKRQPSLAESVPATIERFKIIDKLPRILGKHIGGVMLCGSMSYGPFFNVRKYMGNHKSELWSSDIDLVAILNEGFGETEGWQTLMGSNTLSEVDRETFLARVRQFARMYEARSADIFTHRFDINGADFNLGIHCLPVPVFAKLFNTHLGDALRCRNNAVYSMKDFKPTPFRRTICMERGFDGTSIPYYVPMQQSVKGGVISQLNGFIIRDGKLYPGLYQGMLLPEFSIIHNHGGTTPEMVHRYKSLLVDQVIKERELAPSSSLVKAHVRYSVFAPERYDHLGIRN